MENFFTVRNCSVSCCHGQHFIKFNDSGLASIPVWELFSIGRCWEKNLKNICGVVCESNNLCLAHKRLKIFKVFTEEIREKNWTKNIVAETIRIKDNCKHPFCMNNWCFVIGKTKWVSTDVGLSYCASKYL